MADRARKKIVKQIHMLKLFERMLAATYRHGNSRMFLVEPPPLDMLKTPITPFWAVGPSSWRYWLPIYKIDAGC